MPVRIDPSRDALFDELGLMRLRESYMRPDEKSPQERFAYVAEKFATDEAHAQRIYDYASRHWLSFSTPILSFGRSKKGLPISCFLAYMDDSAEGLVDTLSEVNWLSMLGGWPSAFMSASAAPTKRAWASCRTSKSTMRRASPTVRLDPPRLLRGLSRREPPGHHFVR